MKTFVLLGLMLVSCVTFAKDAKDDCPSAADAAEAQNPNLYKDCDYSNTGLTKAFKKAFGVSAESGDGKEAKEKADLKEEQLVEVAATPLVSEFSSAQQFNNVKFAVLAKAMQECPKGFVIDSEQYLPVQKKSLKLELKYHCL